MYLTGFADEASQDLATQIAVTKELGWNAIESRNIWGTNIHDLSQEEFEKACQMLDEAGIYINCFGSAICNWARDVDDDWNITLGQVKRAIPRMKQLGTKLIRIMSFKRYESGDQKAQKRFQLLREVNDMFTSEGLLPVHENCMNYGGMSWQHTIELVENVPGLKLVYDTGNPVYNIDYSKSDDIWQDSWEFYQNVKEHIAYIHVKDGLNPVKGQKDVYSYPGEGVGYTWEIMKDLKESGYDGGISIEPHMAAVFHDADAGGNENGVEIYLEYGRKLMNYFKEIDYKWSLYSPKDTQVLV